MSWRPKEGGSGRKGQCTKGGIRRGGQWKRGERASARARARKSVRATIKAARGREGERA